MIKEMKRIGRSDATLNTIINMITTNSTQLRCFKSHSDELFVEKDTRNNNKAA